MELTLGVTLAVLGAGMLHAGWNALLKSAGGGDPLLDTATVVAGSTACSLVALPFLPLPDPGAWPFIALSTFIHFGYYLTLAQAYRTGDLSFAYPLMRGTAPLLVTVLGAVFLRELPQLHVIAGIVLISIGIIGIAFARREHHPPAAAYWAFANAAIIAVYTLVDGAGARASGNALALRAVADVHRGRRLPGAGSAGAAARRPSRTCAGSGGAACSAASAASPPTASCCGR